MKKWILIIIAILAIAGIILYFIFNNNTNNSPFNANRMSTETKNENSEYSNNETVQKEIRSATQGLEEEISSFSTPIMDKDENRDHNMEISISKINGTVVKSGDSFSFNNIVGSPTPDKGYEKAGVFVEDKLKRDYGGGNCQVSSTLYNAILKVDGINITERHAHTQEVYYVEKGKDAAVAYGELDLKFKNNTEYNIKINGEVTEKEVKIKILKTDVTD